MVILTVRGERVEEFREFERYAAGVMVRYGGRIERTVVVAPADVPGLVKEVHVVTFPDERTFRAYRDDPRLAERAHLREASVVSTEVLVGEDGPDYRLDLGAKMGSNAGSTGVTGVRPAGETS